VSILCIAVVRFVQVVVVMIVFMPKTRLALGPSRSARRFLHLLGSLS